MVEFVGLSGKIEFDTQVKISHKCQNSIWWKLVHNNVVVKMVVHWLTIDHSAVIRDHCDFNDNADHNVGQF